MSGAGAPEVDIPNCAGLRVVIVASSWHERVMAGLLAGARAVCDEAGATFQEIRVPGAFELPVVAAAYAHKNDAIIALGVVIRGGTPHFDYVCNAATNGLARVAIDAETAVGFGLLTCDSEVQALERAGLTGSSESKGREAAMAALQTALLLKAAANDDSGRPLGFGQ
jgi:6,7-dimethyl-8-ribityllumazine synthase